jgi:hypothetical protein
MSLICVYLLVKTFVFKNEHFQLVFKLKTTPLKIRALISVEVDTVRLETRRTEVGVLKKLTLAGIAKLSRLKYS